MADTREGDDRQQLWDRCFESLKHVTTLSTAAALLILAIYREEPFKERLLALTLILMGLCVVVSVFGMLLISLGSRKPPPNQSAISHETEDATIRWITVTAACVFIAAVVTFGLAVLAVPFWYQLGISLALLVLLIGAILFRVRFVLPAVVAIVVTVLEPLVKAILERREHSTGTVPTPRPEVDSVRADARRVARRLQRFMADRRTGSPISNYPGLELPREGTPEREKLDAEDDAYDRETYRLYRDELHEDVVGVRDAFADLGVTDPELEKLYPSPNTNIKRDAIAIRLIAMADRR